MAKFRFHWGWAIATFYSLFVVVLLIIVIKSFSVDHSLVADNYYDYDIAYQEHSDKLANSRALKKDVAFDHNRQEKKMAIIFPEGFRKYSGTVHFYKPDNKKLDFELAVNPNDSLKQVVNLSELVKGYWRIKMNWDGDETGFYKEYSFYH